MNSCKREGFFNHYFNINGKVIASTMDYFKENPTKTNVWKKVLSIFIFLVKFPTGDTLGLIILKIFMWRPRHLQVAVFIMSYHEKLTSPKINV